MTSHPDQFPVALFAYGTLRQSNVQMATFGRLVEGRPDALKGHVLAPLAILDPYVVEASGLAVHSAAHYTGDVADIVHGTVYGLSTEELDAADQYEVKEMMRVEATLVSGVRAFVYVRAAASTGS